MAETLTAKGALDRIASFRVIYVGIFLYIGIAVCAIVYGAEPLLDRHFRRAVQDAVRVSPANGPIVPQIQERVWIAVRESSWTRIGGVRVTPLVLGADGRTPIYVAGRTLPPPTHSDPLTSFEEADRLLPAIVMVEVSVPLDSLLAGAILVAFGAILVPILFFYNRSVARREEALIAAAIAARNSSADRARSIQTELAKIRNRLDEVEPAERAHAGEISSLQEERESLQQKLRELAQREAEVREHGSQPSELEQERQALEDLLEEAVDDLNHKEDEIRGLNERLKRASKTAPADAQGRPAEQLARRLHTLYRNLEVDQRAIQDIVALREETLKLRAEEGLKKLDDDPGTAGVRRKVGGLPARLAIFELGFAGKRRIYYMRGTQRTYRVLAIGAKNSQKTDLEYLSRL
jgi:signal transduction histidine kinase